LIFRILNTGLLTFVLAGCVTVGPDPVSPTIALSPGFVEGGTRTSSDAAAGYWWNDYRDGTLNDLVARGLSQNLRIRTAIERINEAEAALRTTGTAALVSGGGTAQATRSGGGGVNSDTSSAGLSAALVLDIFGGERRARERATAQFDAAVFDVGTARLAFLSSMVGNYINARYFQEALAVSRQASASRQATLDLVERQFRAGTATELDVTQARALLSETRASLPSLEEGFFSAIYAIATLLAEPAQPLVTSLQRGAPQPRARGNASAGVPAELLRNRPDVNSAERSFAAAVSAIGVAEAELYPSIELGGTITVSSDTTWSFGPSLNLPVFNQPVLRANRDQAVSQAVQAELEWRKSVFDAVEEVQSAQTAYLRSVRRVEAQRAVVDSYQRVVTLSRTTYEGGTTTLINLLDSERTLWTAQLSLAEAIRDLAANWGTLQVAAGRGWR
jgi:outer membrane protein, multidrug efflux system